MTKATKAPAASAPEATGIEIVDNTESQTKAPKLATSSEEYELTEGLVQVNYV